MKSAKRDRTSVMRPLDGRCEYFRESCGSLTCEIYDDVNSRDWPNVPVDRIVIAKGRTLRLDNGNQAFILGPTTDQDTYDTDTDSRDGGFVIACVNELFWIRRKELLAIKRGKYNARQDDTVRDEHRRFDAVR